VCTLVTPPLPHSARLAWALTAWLRGHDSADAVLAELGDPDLVTRVVIGGELVDEHDLLTRLRRTGADGAGLALPVEGDPVGLGGPTSFNLAALEAGEAVVVGGSGLVPEVDGGQLRWVLHEAARRQLPDVGEAARTLRGALASTATRLAELDVARWRPEVADALTNLRADDDLAPPPGTPPRCVELAHDALFAREVVALALQDDGGSVTAHEADARRGALVPLARAARHGLVAACSAEVWPPA